MARRRGQQYDPDLTARWHRGRAPVYCNTPATDNGAGGLEMCSGGYRLERHLGADDIARRMR